MERASFPGSEPSQGRSPPRVNPATRTDRPPTRGAGGVDPDVADVMTTRRPGVRLGQPETAARRDALVSIARRHLKQLQQDQCELREMVEMVIWARQAQVEAVDALRELHDLIPGGRLTWNWAQWDDLNRATEELPSTPSMELVNDPPSNLHGDLEQYQAVLVRTREHVNEMERQAESPANQELARIVREELQRLRKLCKQIAGSCETKSRTLAAQVGDSVEGILKVQSEPESTAYLQAAGSPPSFAEADSQRLANHSRGGVLGSDGSRGRMKEEMRQPNG